MRVIKLLLLCVMLFITVTSQAKEWRGIVPLHSTRADVERLLGKPNAEYGRYEFGNELVDILYSDAPCSAGLQGMWNVPRDTVISIRVAPKDKRRIFNLGLDLSRYERVGDPFVLTHTSYVNKVEGISYEVFEGGGEDNGQVLNVFYEAAGRDAHLRCPDSANNTLEGTQTSTDQVPRGDQCPTIKIVGPPGGKCRGQRCSISEQLSGSDPNLSPTFEWKVSAGTILSGQGTGAIEIDISNAGDKPIIVTVKVGGVIPWGCPNTASYTVETAKPSTQVSRPGSCRAKRTKD